MAHEIDPEYIDYLKSQDQYKTLFTEDTWAPFEATPDFTELDDDALAELPRDWLRGKFVNGQVTTKRLC